MGRLFSPLIFLAIVMLSCRKMDMLGRTEIEKGSTLWQGLFQAFSLLTHLGHLH